MSLRERLAWGLFGDVIRGVAREAAESDRGWRPISGSGIREVPYTDVVKALEESDAAYRNHPMASRIVELTVDFVLGRGLALRSTEKAVQRWLDEWWGHSMNGWPIRQFDLCRELSLAGEVFVTLHTNPVDGMSYVRQVPAVLIDQVETSAEDIEDERRYHQVGQVAVVEGVKWAAGGSLEGRWWERDGEGAVMRHYAVNRLVGTVRGQGDLVVLLPWLRRYRDWLVDRVRLSRYRQAYLWDVTVVGGDRRAIASRQQELGAEPAPGSILIHNDREVWQALRPELASDDAEKDGLALRLLIAAGSGFPLHFLGEAAEANLATATAMEMPTIRRLERRQLYFGWLVVDLARVALERSGRFGETSRAGVRCEFERLRPEDQAAIAASVSSVVQACAVAREKGWLRDDEARELFARFVGEPATTGILADVVKLPGVDGQGAAG